MTATDQQSLHDLADALFAAFEANDAATIERLCAPDARFSQNGSRPVAVSALLPTFASMRDRIGQHRYSEVRRGVFADGLVEEHTVETVLPDGTPVRLRACVVVRVDGSGRVVELSEYLDPSKMQGGGSAAR
jgi:ketosteroid isomerase-like protein